MEHLISWRTGAAGHTVARQTDPLALPAGAAARSSSLSVDLWGRRAQHPALDRTLMARRRVLALTFRPDFIHWRVAAERGARAWQIPL